MEAAVGSRHVVCDGAFNVRDLGGYPTADGSRTKLGTVYRADGLHRASADDVQRLGELGWRTVLDLRTLSELEHGEFRCPGTEVVHLPVLKETWDIAGVDHDTDPVEYLVDRYLEMLDQGAVAFASAFDILAAPGRRPVVFHCSAGKDRAGVLAALLLAAVGVADKIIAADYALSGTAICSGSSTGTRGKTLTASTRWRSSRTCCCPARPRRCWSSSPASASSTGRWPSTCSLPASPRPPWPGCERSSWWADRRVTAPLQAGARSRASVPARGAPGGATDPPGWMRLWLRLLPCHRWPSRSASAVCSRRTG